MRDSDPLTRLTAARFDGPQALYTEAVRLLSERPALPDDLAGLVTRLRGEKVFMAQDAADAIEELAAENARLTDDAAAAEIAALSDPLVVHMNMLNGRIAKPPASQLTHIYGEKALRPLTEAAVAAALEAAVNAIWPIVFNAAGAVHARSAETAIRALITADASAALDRIKAAAKAEGMLQVADARTWFHYPIVMPMKDGRGPVSDTECDTITWEVWDQLLNTHASFDNLPDAINEAMRLNAAIPEVQK